MGEKHGRSFLLTKHLFRACKVILSYISNRTVEVSLSKVKTSKRLTYEHTFTKFRRKVLRRMRFDVLTAVKTVNVGLLGCNAV
jgi:hypothetical protein